MEVGTTSMKALSADSEGDLVAARDFCQEALTEAAQRASFIEHIRDLRQILDHDSLQKATSALAGVRHITLAIEDVAQTHQGDRIGKIFGDTHSKLFDLQTKAAENHEWLCSIFPSSKPPVSSAGTIG